MAASVTAADQDIYYHSFPISKMETDPATGTLYVYGKATTPEIDSDDQIVDAEWSAKAMEAWFKSGPNVRIQHNPNLMPAGSGVKVEIDRDGDQAHWVKAAIDDPTAKMMCVKGHLRAFSVGIARPLIVRDVTGKARGGIIKGGELAEISLVDRPANRSCYVELAKSAGDDGHAEFTGKVGGAGILGKAAPAASKSVTVELPEDVSVSFSPGDLAKLLEHRRVAEDNQVSKDWTTWDEAHQGEQRQAAGTKPDAHQEHVMHEVHDQHLTHEHAEHVAHVAHEAHVAEVAHQAHDAHDAHDAHEEHEEHEAAVAARNAANAHTSSSSKPAAKKPVVPSPTAQNPTAQRQAELQAALTSKGAVTDPDEENPVNPGEPAPRKPKTRAKPIDDDPQETDPGAHAKLDDAQRSGPGAKTATAVKRDMDPDVGGGTDRDKIPAADFAGRNRSYPIKTPGDVSDAATSIGRAGPDNHSPDQLRSNITRIAHRKGPKFIAQLPASWQNGAGKAASVDELIKAEDEGEECDLCDGSGKIRDGHLTCPRCHGDGKKSPGEPDENGDKTTTGPELVKVGPHGFIHGWIKASPGGNAGPAWNRSKKKASSFGSKGDAYNRARVAAVNATKKADETGARADHDAAAKAHGHAADLARQAATESMHSGRTGSLALPGAKTSPTIDFRQRAEDHEKVATAHMTAPADDEYFASDPNGEYKDMDADLEKTGKRTCGGCGKNHHADSPAKFCDDCGHKLPGSAKEDDPDLTKGNDDDAEDEGGKGDDAKDDADEDDESDDDPDDGEDDGDGSDDDPEDGDDEDSKAGKAAKRTPADGVPGKHADPVPAHREPDGLAIESLEHDAGLPTDPDRDYQKAAHLRFKSLGVPSDLGALHDLTCAAYHPGDVAKCHPAESVQGLINPDAWAEKAFAAATGAPLDEAAKAQRLWQHTVTVKGASPVVIDEVNEAVHKAFQDANPGPGTAPTPIEIHPARFNRPYITGGHAAASPGQAGPNTAKVPDSDITAAQFGRGPLTDDHAAASPGAQASKGEGRLFYRNTDRDSVAQAMAAIHDHIAATFPSLCPMSGSPAMPLPEATGKTASSSDAAAPAEVAPDDEEATRQWLAGQVLKGDMTVNEAREVLDLPPLGFPTPDLGQAAAAWTGKAAGAFSPDLIKSAVADAIGPLAEQIADARETLTAQGKLIRKQAKALDALANEPDPAGAPYRGPAFPHPLSSLAPEGPVDTVNKAAERSQTALLTTLQHEWRTSPDPSTRERAYQALRAQLGISGDAGSHQ